MLTGGHHRGDGFSTGAIRDTHNRNFGDLRVHEQCVFNFEGGQFVAAGLDDIDRRTTHNPLRAASE